MSLNADGLLRQFYLFEVSLIYKSYITFKKTIIMEINN